MNMKCPRCNKKMKFHSLGSRSGECSRREHIYQCSCGVVDSQYEYLGNPVLGAKRDRDAMIWAIIIVVVVLGGIALFIKYGT